MLQSNTFGFGRFYSNLETWDILVKQGIPGSVSSASYMYHAAIFLQVLAPLYSEMHRPLSQSLEIILLFGVELPHDVLYGWYNDRSTSSLLCFKLSPSAFLLKAWFSSKFIPGQVVRNIHGEKLASEKAFHKHLPFGSLYLLCLRSVLHTLRA